MRLSNFKVILFALIAIIIGYSVYFMYFIPTGYVGIEINPSIQLSLNRMNRVIEVMPLNEDADILLSDLTLTNMTVEEALEAIIDSSTELGYIDELEVDNAIAISVASDTETADEVEERIKNRLEKFLTNKNIPALVLLEKNNEERKALAESYGISNGKMLLIQKAIALNPNLVEAELVNEPVRSIAKLFKEARTEIKEARKEERKQQLAELKEQRKNSYRAKYDNAIQDRLEKDERIKQNATEVEREQIKKAIIKEIKESKKEQVEKIKERIEGNWSNVDTGNNDIPEDVKNRIKNIRDKWSNSQQ